MERRITEISPSLREAIIELNREDLKKQIDKAYNTARAEISLKGFRPGKVPIDIIKQRFGREIESDAMQAAAESEFKALMEDSDLELVGGVTLTDLHKEPDLVRYTYRFEVVPEFELPSYKGLAITSISTEVVDADVDEEAERVRHMYGTTADAEEVAHKYFLVDISRRRTDAETGMPIIGADPEELTLYMADPKLDSQLASLLMDRRKGEMLTYTEAASEPDEAPTTWMISITGIREIIPAELTEDWITKVTDNAASTVEEYRAYVREALEVAFEKESRRWLEVQLVEQITASVQLEAPAALVHEAAHDMFHDYYKDIGHDHHDHDAMFAEFEMAIRPMAERTAKWRLVLGKLLKTEAITPAGVIKHTANLMDLEETEVGEYLKQNEQMAGQLTFKLLFDKLIGYSIIQPRELEIPFTSPADNS